MAERIGSAYVKVFFRSSGDDLDDQIKKDKGFEKAGETAADKTGKGFNEEWVKQTRERLKTDKDYLKKQEAAYKGQMTRLQNDLDKFWKDERKKISQGIGTPLDDIDRSMRKMEGRWQRLFDKMPDFHEVLDDTEDIDRRMSHLSLTLANVSGWAVGIGESFKESSKEVEVETEKITRNTGSFFDRLKAGWTDTRNEQRRTDRENGTFFKRWEKRSGSLGGFLSKMFGKGARNNFMNLVGTIVSGLTSIPTLGLKGFGAIAPIFGKDMTKPMEESATAAEGLGSQLAGLAAMAPEIGIALVVALAGLPLLLSAVASLIMLLTGAVIALAGALTFALIGAIGAVAGALVPLAAGVGVVMLAMTSLSKKSQHAFDGFKASVRDAIKPLAEVAAKHLFAGMADDSGKVAKAIGALTPLVAAVADALNAVGKAFLDAMTGPGAKKFIGFLTATLPGMITQLGTIAGNVGQALGGLFIAVTPLVQEFLGWLTGVTGTLADMGKGGSKSKLSKFFADLQPTMDAVGHAISEVVGLVFDLFEGPGQKTGGQMFQSIADNVRKFRDFLAQAKKDGSLQKFFDDAKKFSDKIGEAVIEVGKLIGALDTPEMRQTLIFMADSFVKVVRGAVRLSAILAAQMKLWFMIGRAIGRAFGAIPAAVRHAVKAIKETFAPVKPFIQNLLKNISWTGLTKAAKHAWAAIKDTFAPVGPWFAARGHAIAQAFQTAWGLVKSAAGAAKEWVQGKWNDLVGWFSNLGHRLTTAAGWASIGQAIGSAIFNAIIGALTGLPGQIVGLFAGLASRIVSQIGSINLFPHINWPSPPGWLSKITAQGGVFAGAQMRVIGEAGPEAVVPLNRPLAQVDPAVRWLSAIAQGKSITSGSSGRGGRTIDIGGITINTPTKDPVAVATQVVNRVAAASYI